MPFHWGELEFTDKGPPRVLEGRAVTILGGGPSLTREVSDAVQIGPTIAANNSFMLLHRPGLVVALDKRWFEWHGQPLKAAGHFAVTAQRNRDVLRYSGPHAILKKDRSGEWPDDPLTLPGLNSGHAAISLAILMGATRIWLAGFDMGFEGERTHWHAGHAIPSSQGNYERRFRPHLENLATEGKKRGVLIAAITKTQAEITRLELSYALKELRLENSMDHHEARTPL